LISARVRFAPIVPFERSVGNEDDDGSAVADGAGDDVVFVADGAGDDVLFVGDGAGDDVLLSSHPATTTPTQSC
jgi:hypothetical protein